jgi:hypothetical protein
MLGDGAVERHTVLSDLSATGARIATAGPPAVGRSIRLVFDLAAQRDVEAHGRVVWRTQGFGGRGGLVGVVFERVSAPEAIAAFVRGS